MPLASNDTRPSKIRAVLPFAAMLTKNLLDVAFFNIVAFLCSLHILPGCCLSLFLATSQTTIPLAALALLRHQYRELETHHARHLELEEAPPQSS